MAFSLNKVMLIGNLGQDAEHRFTTNNTEVSSFSIATEYSYKGKDGNWVKQVTWHNIVVFGASDFLKGNLKKGKKFYIEGRINKRDYENKDGQKVYVSEVIADKFSIIPLETSFDSNQSSSNDSGETFSKPDAIDSTPAAEDDDLPF